MIAHVSQWLALARMRSATSILLEGRAHPLYGRIDAVYFALAAPAWGRLAHAGPYLEPLRAGLEHVREPAHAADLGTGAGPAAGALAQRFPGAEVVGIDRSRVMLAQARRRHRAANLRFVRGRVTALPLPDAGLDLVTLLNAVAAPAEIRRVLRPGGELLTASSLTGLHEAPHWEALWRDAGLERVGAQEVAPGYWELFRAI